MTKIVVIGAGAHSKVVVDILKEHTAFDLIGLTDEVERGDIFGVPILGGDEFLPSLLENGVTAAFVAVGDNKLREKLSKKAFRIGFKLITLVDKRAIVSKYAVIEDGTLVMPGAVVNAAARIGRGSIINTNASIDHECIIGEFAHIAPGCALSGRVKVGNRSLIGTGARVIDRIRVGDDAVIGAGASVVRDIPPRAEAVGVPARVIKFL